MKKISSFLLVLAAMTGCATDSSSTEIATTPLAGMVSGKPWTVAMGQTNAFLSSGQGDFFAELYPTAFTACGTSEPSGPHLIVAVPKAVGDYPMSLQRNMTFTDGDKNLVAVDGRIVVTEVTATSVKGGLHGTYDGS